VSLGREGKAEAVSSNSKQAVSKRVVMPWVYGAKRALGREEA
jgi:hypothetical protein